MSDRVKINIYIQAELLRALQRLAAAQDLPYSELIRVACREYVLANTGRILNEQKQLAKAVE